mmetsp:Transcript_26053/g.65660  ORF Transcript_26053/g.65660 Transcript_26053/m.65660 type:complete len:175 (+) Transcript_26053:5641-6165(+)|eukprot:g13069.t1
MDDEGNLLEPVYALTDQQLESFRAVFAMYQQPTETEEQTALCKWEDFPAIFRTVNQNPTQKELDIVIAEFKKAEGFDVDTFLKIMDSTFAKDPSKPEVLIEAFRQFDRNGSGILPAAIMRYALGCIGDALELDSVDEFMDYAHSVADKEKNGEIDYELLVKNLFEKDPGITACL